MEENANPQTVIEAVIDAPEKFGDVTIGDITILKYAYLERLKSPFLDPSVEFTVESVVPSVYVLAQDKDTLRKHGRDVEGLKEAALEWADEKLKVQEVPEIIKSIVAKLQRVNGAAPNGAQDPKKN